MHHFCVTGSFTSPNKTRNKIDIKKLRSLDHSELQNVESCTNVDWFTVNCQSYMKLSTHEWNKYKSNYNQT